jgi:Cytochrome c7 and related cytochrome c
VLTGRHLILAASMLSLAGLVAISCEPNNEGYEPTQPIEYSHAVHAGSMQIPCQYCHYSASTSRHAGIPPAQICMNCHSHVKPDHPEVLKVKAALDSGEPIRWIRVHEVPDHVYFDHSAHVGNGVACEQCHGEVSTMGRVRQWAPLTMGWCLDCHRGEPDTPSHDQGGRLTDCAVCHH